ncbi:MAG: hypothetical protein GX633_09745 [Clostridiales bacterium]|nr:hypothetical protein [Clostridiales bacterium]
MLREISVFEEAAVKREIESPDIGIDDLDVDPYLHYDMINRTRKLGIAYRMRRK